MSNLQSNPLLAMRGLPPFSAIRADSVEAAIDTVLTENREVIQQACIEGRKIKEIAERMHRSPEAVMKLLSRALQRLRAGFPPTESLHLPDRSLGEARGEEHGRG